MTFLGIGRPGAGIRLQRGHHAGRLLVRVFSNEDASQFSAAVIYSDDGLTWRRSGSTNDDRAVEGVRIDRARSESGGDNVGATVVNCRMAWLSCFRGRGHTCRGRSRAMEGKPGAR